MNDESFPPMVAAGRADFRQHALALLALGTHKVQAILPGLDPAFWNDREVCARLQELTVRHPQALCHLCVQDHTNVRRDNPRLMHLLERLPSRVEIRLADVQHRGMGESLILVDRRYFLRRSSRQAQQWQSHSHQPNEAPRLAELFDDVWGQSAAHADLRNLRL